MYVVCFITWVLLCHLGKLIKRTQGKIYSQVQQDWNPSRQQKVLHVQCMMRERETESERERELKLVLQISESIHNYLRFFFHFLMIR